MGDSGEVAAGAVMKFGDHPRFAAPTHHILALGDGGGGGSDVGGGSDGGEGLRTSGRHGYGSEVWTKIMKVTVFVDVG